MNRLALSAWIILSCLGLSYSGCPQGWFGSNCQYKCRCADQQCEAFGGNCLDGVKCMPGWFGPACQYEDVMQSMPLDQSLLPPYVIRDLNDNTCVDDITQQVLVAWTIPYQFTWLRAVVKDPEFLSTMSLHFKTGESADSIDCTDRQQARVSETTLDIHCDMQELVKQVILTGEGVKNLCSLYISGGRNVALKQRTRQSSTYHEISNSLSGNAVDGNRDSDFQHHSCTATDTGDSKPTWSVYLPGILSVNRYVLYNRNQNAQRLQRFLLESYNKKGVSVFKFEDMAPTFQYVYTITSTSPASPVSHVTIQVPHWDVFAHTAANYLTLCEVEIFGDSVCESGLYGRECEHKCNCADSDDFCFVSTGGCPSGCAPGFRGESCDQVCRNGTHGPDCSNSCSQFCRMSGDNTTACDHVHGTCLFGCLPGYSGSTCYEECDRETFGQDCNSSCPQHCENIDFSPSVCDHVTGVCTQACQPGYTGDHCDEHCDRETHGRDCNSICPQHCEDTDTSLSVCHHVSGVCTQGCLPGYKGDHCDEQCDKGTFGRDCNSTCPQHCENINTSLSVCDHVTGVCTQGCLPGYTGDRCDQHCDRGRHGQDCNSTCPQHCENINTSLSVCDHVSGVCTQGCQPGYTGDRCDEHCDRGRHGRDCNSTCPQHCENINTSLSVCDHVSGVCTQGCQPGYTGDRCDQHCDRGRHGRDCNSTCPQHCENINISLSVCDHVSGVCTQGCQPGYTGDHCDQHCDRGRHGRDCNSTCPQHCGDINTSLSVCDHVTGVCTQGCQPGYTGDRCDQHCDRGRHGHGCNSTCPQHCENINTSLSVCDHVSGVCTQGCQPGYTGDRCDQLKPNTTIENNSTFTAKVVPARKENSVTHSTSRTAGAVAGGFIVAVAVVVVVGVIILWKFKKFHSFKIWTSSHNSCLRSESTIVLATEMSEVQNDSL